MPEPSLKDLSIAVRPETTVTFNNVFNFFAAALLPQHLISMPEADAGPCRTESSDVGFDFIVVGTNKI